MFKYQVRHVYSKSYQLLLPSTNSNQARLFFLILTDLSRSLILYEETFKTWMMYLRCLVDVTDKSEERCSRN